MPWHGFDLGLLWPQHRIHNLITAGSKQDPCHTKMLPWKFAENASSINIQLVGLKGTPFSFGTVKRSYALCWQGLNLHRNPNGFPQWNGSVHVSWLCKSRTCLLNLNERFMMCMTVLILLGMIVHCLLLDNDEL